MARKIVISNSMLRSLTRCETQSWLRTRGYAGLAAEGKRLRAGRDAHLAAEAWLNGHNADECVAYFRSAYGEYSNRYLLDRDAYSVDNLSRLLTVFFQANPLPAMEFRVIHTEQQLELPVYRDGNTTYVVSDKSDAIVQMLDTNDLMSFELKTTGYIGEDYLADYALDSQITTHVAACRANGFDVKGVLLQVIQFNKLPDPLALTPKTKKPVQCRAAGHGLQRDCWTQHVLSARFALTRTPKQVDTWRNNVVPMLIDYERLIRQQDVVAAGQRGLFGECGRCEFQPFCLSERRAWDRLTQREREQGVLYSGIYEA